MKLTCALVVVVFVCAIGYARSASILEEMSKEEKKQFFQIIGKADMVCDSACMPGGAECEECMKTCMHTRFHDIAHEAVDCTFAEPISECLSPYSCLVACEGVDASDQEECYKPCCEEWKVCSALHCAMMKKCMMMESVAPSVGTCASEDCKDKCPAMDER